MTVSVGVREFKNHMGEYLRRVKAGEIVELTQRGTPVARIVPAQPPEEAVEARIRELVAQGKAHWSGRRLTPHEPVGPVRSGVSLSDLIVQERDESLSRFEQPR